MNRVHQTSMRPRRRALSNDFVTALLLFGVCGTTARLKLLQVEDIDGVSMEATGAASYVCGREYFSSGLYRKNPYNRLV